jgi:hypothetical protein
LYDSNGQPFSQDIVDEAFKKSEEALAPGFKATKEYDTSGFENTLEDKKSDYEKYLGEEASSFENEKTALDQDAADKGVLFSGGRAEKEKKLQNIYSSNEAYNKDKYGRSIADTTREFQYKYGNEAVQNPTISKYFNAGGNTYNANVARGGVGTQKLSSFYNPSKYDFQGTAVNTNKANIATRAAGLLANRGNKLLSTGFKNQF